MTSPLDRLRAISLALPGPNWKEVADRLEGSYRLVAPRRLLAALDE